MYGLMFEKNLVYSNILCVTNLALSLRLKLKHNKMNRQEECHKNQTHFHLRAKQCKSESQHS
jgi:hypothetical protein